MFVHHVFFWLKEDLSSEDIQKFEARATALLQIEHVKTGDVGKPADTDRTVIDRSYSYSLLLIFDDKAGHDAYQPHEIHKTFVDDCSDMWNRVVIYDSETV